MFKKFCALCSAIILILSLSGCEAKGSTLGTDKFSIVATVFPAYDFSREIAGDEADVTLLIPPGTEIHGFEPTPQDIMRIEKCDLLVCNGGESEEWLEEILEGLDREIPAVRMMDCVETVEEETKEGMQSAGHAHSHEHGEEEHGHGEEEHDHDHEERGHEMEYDEHVWSSPVNAIDISREICRTLCVADSEKSELYKANCEKYCEKLFALDTGIRDIVSSSRCRTVIFADRFPVRYFVEEYGLDYYAAFPGCAEDTEPSAKTVAFLIDKVRDNNIRAVFYIEFSNEKMADIICEDTGCEKLLFHSCQNVSADEFTSGVSYLELMTQNAENLREALG